MEPVYTDQERKKEVAVASGQGVAKGAIAGAQMGASVGSVVPAWGTLIGGIVGGVVGGVAGGVYGGVKQKKYMDEAEKSAAEAYNAQQDAQQVRQRQRALSVPTEEDYILANGTAPQGGTSYDMWHAQTYGRKT